MLVVRPEPGLGETLAALRERGHQGIAAPMQRIVPVALRLGPMSRVRAVLVTSGQAVPAVAAERERLAGCVVLAVGDATARRAREAGFAGADSAGGDAEALRHLVRVRLRPEEGTLLLACGAGHAEPLARALRADGYRVLRRVAYRTTPERRLDPGAARAIRDGQVAAALFFSAEAAAAFRRALRGAGVFLGEIRALAISERAAAVLRGMGWRAVEGAAAPNAAALLALLDRGGQGIFTRSGGSA